MAGTGSSRPHMSSASTPSVGTNPPRPRVPPRNAVGQKQDIGWKHGDPIDGNPNGSKCRYCKKLFSSGGVYRLKHHLALLKWFAMRVLNLTCSSSGCERNWSAFEMVHSKKRNRLNAKKLNDLVYVMVNGKLRKSKNERSKRSLDIEDIDDDWIAGDDEEGEDGEDFVNLDEELVGDVEGNNSATTDTLMDELDVNVDNQEDDGDDGEEGYGGEDHNVDHMGDPNEGIDYGAYDDDGINEDEEDDIMGDMANINMNDLI